MCTLDTFSVGVFNVGTPSDPAHIRLVNDFLNDKDRANPLKVKDGEILVAGRLRIDENSKLDLNGLGLKVTGPLVLAPTATLDLNTGTLKGGLDWDNPGFTYWQVVAPLPSTVIVIR